MCARISIFLLLGFLSMGVGCKGTVVLPPGTSADGADATDPADVLDKAVSVAGFKGLLAVQYDHLPEQAFYMVGGIEEVQAKADAMAAEEN